MMNGCNLRNDSNDDDRPRFAVIRLKPESNLLGLFQLLLCNGFGEVAFVKNLNDANFGGNKEITCSQSCVDECVQDSGNIGNNGKRTVGDTTRKSSALDGSEKSVPSGSQIFGETSCGAAETILFVAQSSAKAMIPPAAKCQDRGSAKGEKYPSINRSIGQAIASSEIPISPILPLATLSCPMPLPVDQCITTAARLSSSKLGESSKKLAVSKSVASSISTRSAPGTSGAKIYSSTHAKNAAQFTSTQPIAQRSSGAKETPQQQVYVSCHLCNSKIMATRFSNLTNHVRRHAPVKQFQCLYCDYAHNEIAKVRLHMANNHGDKKSRPVNNINAEMQDTWRRLMRECFPERSKRQRHPQPLKQPQGTSPNPKPTATAIVSHGTHITSNTVKAQMEEKSDETAVKVEPIAVSSLFPLYGEEYQWNTENEDSKGQRFARCDQCYAYVNVKMKESHVRTCHLNNLPSASFVCSLCGLENIERKEVETHIRLEHGDSPDAQVINADLAAYVDQMIDEYFPLHALEYTTNSTNFNTNIFEQLKPPIESIEDDSADSNFALFNGAASGNEIDPRWIQLLAHSPMRRKCRVCRRMVSNGHRSMHARRHVEMSAVYFECPVCANYRSNASGRVQRHLADKHGVTNCDDVPRIVRNEWIPVVGFDNAVAQAVKRCFGKERIAFKRRYAWKKCVYFGRIHK